MNSRARRDGVTKSDNQLTRSSERSADGGACKPVTNAL